MPSYVYEQDDGEPEEIRVNADDIAVADDVEELREWMESFETRAIEIGAQVKTAKDLGTGDIDWMHRAVAAAGWFRAGAALSKRRLKELGQEFPEDTQAIRLAHLERVVAKYARGERKREIDAMIATVLRELVGDVQFQGVLAEVYRRLGIAAEADA
jgi:hypothetical protein